MHGGPTPEAFGTSDGLLSGLTAGGHYNLIHWQLLFFPGRVIYSLALCISHYGFAHEAIVRF